MNEKKFKADYITKVLKHWGYFEMSQYIKEEIFKEKKAKGYSGIEQKRKRATDHAHRLADMAWETALAQQEGLTS